MKFSVVIGNPPYQEMDGGGGTTESSLPLYNQFIIKFMDSGIRFISMIIPSRWMSGGKSVLDLFRNKVVLSNKFKEIVIYKKCWDVFSNVDIPGGVQYFLYDNEYNSRACKVVNKQKINNVSIRDLGKYRYRDNSNNDQYMIIGDNKAINIIDKVISFDELRMTDKVLPRSPFGIDSFFEDSDIKSEEKPIKVICSNGRITYTSFDKITDNYNVIDKYKVIIGKVNPDRGGNNSSDKYNVISKPIILNPNEVCTTTFLVLDTFDNIKDANNFITYSSTKLFRFLIYTTLTGTSMSNKNFVFIPVQDYNDTWSNEKLYNKYDISVSEKTYIEEVIKEW